MFSGRALLEGWNLVWLLICFIDFIKFEALILIYGFLTFSVPSFYVIFMERLLASHFSYGILKTFMSKIVCWHLSPEECQSSFQYILLLLVFITTNCFNSFQDILHWRIYIGRCPAHAPLRVQILSFWHMKFSKRNCLGSPRPHPPTRSTPLSCIYVYQ